MNKYYEPISETIDKTAARVVKYTHERGSSPGTAESCTGGTLSAAVTSVPETSAVFGGGLFSLAGIFTKERVAQTARQPGIMEGFRVLIRNKPLLRIVLSNMLMSAGGLYNVFTTYYFAEVLKLNSLKLLIDIPGGAVGIGTYPFIPAIKRRFDNKQLMIIHFIAKAAEYANNK